VEAYCERFSWVREESKTMCGGIVILNSEGKHVANDLSTVRQECPSAGGKLSFFVLM